MYVKYIIKDTCTCRGTDLHTFSEYKGDNYRAYSKRVTSLLFQKKDAREAKQVCPSIHRIFSNDEKMFDTRQDHLK